MKFCSNCGKQLNDDAMFCSGCGSKQVAAPQPQQPVVQLSGKYQCTSGSVPGALYVYDFMPANYAVYVTMKGTRLRNTFLEYGSYKVEGDRFAYTILQNPVASLVGQSAVSYIIPSSDGFVMKFSDYDIHCTR